jgi:VanZ family protein
MWSSRRAAPAAHESPQAPHRRPQRCAGFWFSVWWPVALGLLVIGIESTPYLGADETSGPLRRLFEASFGPVGDLRWDILHHLIRKSGHFVGYGLIALAWLRAWWFTLPRARYFQDFALALLGTALIASCDEWHQSFLPNRSASPWDVLLDCSGAVVLCLLTYLFLRITHPDRLVRPV